MQDWTDVTTAIVAALSFCIAAAAFAVSLWQRADAKAAQRGQALFYVHQFASRPEFVTARMQIRSSPPPLSLKDWTKDQCMAADLVCGCYDQVGLLLENPPGSQIVDDFLQSSWGQSVVMQADWLSPYLDVKGRRQFFRHFVALAAKARAFHPTVVADRPSSD